MVPSVYSDYRISLLNEYCPVNRPVEGVVNLGLSKEYLDKKLAKPKFGFHDVLITCIVKEKCFDPAHSVLKTKVREVYRNTHNTAGAGSTSFCYLEEGYEFPFSFCIPETIGPSFELMRGYPNAGCIECGIFCYIEASLLHSNGGEILSTKFTIKKPFFRTGAPMTIIPPRISSKVKVGGSLGLFGQKRTFVTAQSDSSTYSLQDGRCTKVGLQVGFEDGDTADMVTHIETFIIQRIRKTMQTPKKEYIIDDARHVVGESKVKLKRDQMEVSYMDNSINLSASFHKCSAISQRAAWVNKAESHLLCASGTAVLTNITVHVEYEICIKVSFKGSGTVTLNPIPIKLTHADIEWESNTKTKRNPPKYSITSQHEEFRDLFSVSSLSEALGVSDDKNDKNKGGAEPPEYMDVLAHPTRFSLKSTDGRCFSTQLTPPSCANLCTA
eukprot:Nk52_evm24s2011 gene=Nk52_evmTU24s2011